MEKISFGGRGSSFQVTISFSFLQHYSWTRGWCQSWNCLVYPPAVVLHHFSPLYLQERVCTMLNDVQRDRSISIVIWKLQIPITSKVEKKRFLISFLGVIRRNPSCNVQREVLRWKKLLQHDGILFLSLYGKLNECFYIKAPCGGIRNKSVVTFVAHIWAKVRGCSISIHTCTSHLT